MRVALSTIGSRGDVQPLLALALQLCAAGHQVRVCAPPTLADLIVDFGLQFVPVGHDVRQGPRYVPGGAASTVATQFETLRAGLADCDVIVGCAAMQIATRSIAEFYGVPYFYGAYAPVTLPSPQHDPLPVPGRPPMPADADRRTRWKLDAQQWNDTWRAGLNAQRAAIGLQPVTDVRSHVFTNRPLLAADPTLAPWPTPSDIDVLQTGAWLWPDRRPLPDELEAFLDAGAPPICFGFGSTMTPRTSGPVLVSAARALGYRAVVLRGWADLAPTGRSPDCLAVGEVNQQALFARVAAIVHHGGAGTTTAAALAGVPQVVIPHDYDQRYFAQRVSDLGMGTAHPPVEPTVDSVAAALDATLAPAVAAQARALTAVIRRDGTAVAARRILQAG